MEHAKPASALEDPSIARGPEPDFLDEILDAGWIVAAEQAGDLQTRADAELGALRDDERLPLLDGAVVHYRAAFLDPAFADWCLDVLRPGGAAGVPWARRPVTLYGRECLERRATAFYGTPGATYRYSGRDNTSLDWSADPTGALEQLRRLASELAGAPFNFLLANCYEPGDAITPHSDDERPLVRGSPIFSVSLGCARRFVFDPKTDGGGGLSLYLAHGSALVMAGDTQTLYKHSVPAAKTAKGTRVNLTFRWVKDR